MRWLPILLVLAACGGSAPQVAAPHQIRIVGASAGLPFAADAAERYTLARPDSIAPLAQADGSASGIARFCRDRSERGVDLVIATRTMTPAERADCAANGSADVVEIAFGWTAPVFVAGDGGPPPALAREQAVAALTTTARRWSDLGPSLPAVPIALYGPSSALLAGDGGGLVPDGRTIRRDGGYQPLGADAALVASTVAATPGAVGLVPYAYAARPGLCPVALDGVAPSALTIADGRYRPRLPLLLILRAGDIGRKAGLRELLGLFAASTAPSGAFARLGLVPLDRAGRAAAGRAFAAAGIAAQL